MLYAHKKFVITELRKAKKGEILSTIVGDEPLIEGELIAKDLNGDEFSITENMLNKNYVKFDHLAMANGYIEMAKINLEEAEAGRYTYNDGLLK